MLKWIAAWIMLIDHFGIVFISPPSTLYYILRLIGRLAMPVFAYYIAKGFIMTKNFKKYILRLGVMAVAAQIPYTLLGSAYSLNLMDQRTLKVTFFNQLFRSFSIGVTFLCALFVLYFLQKSSQLCCTSIGRRILYRLGIFASLLIALFADYSLYGVGMVLLFYYFIQYKDRIHFSYLYLALAMLTLTILAYGFSSLTMQGACVFSILLIRYVKEDGLKLPRYFFYWFYPVHMMALIGIKLLF